MQLQLNWNKEQDERLFTDAQKKQKVSLVKEGKRLGMLEELKACQGPFIYSEEVNLYLDDPEVS